MSDEAPARGSLPYGPFTPQIRRFLQHLTALSPQVEQAVVAEYRLVVATAEYQAAERALGSAIARSGRERERDALGGPLLQIVRANRTSAASAVPANSPEPASLSATPLRPIAEPALAALLAILMQDVLSAELFARLYTPFERSITRVSLQQ